MSLPHYPEGNVSQPTDSEQKSLVKLVDLTASGGGGSGLSYGADEQVIGYYGSTNNIHTIEFRRAGVALKTRTLTYAGGGSADNDKLTHIVDA